MAKRRRGRRRGVVAVEGGACAVWPSRARYGGRGGGRWDEEGKR